VGVTPEEEPYLVMEYLEGEGLSTMLHRTGPLDLPAACGILEPVLLALAAAHDKGIVHRDLKPENIFLVKHPGEAPTVKLIDFGLSKITKVGGEQTQLTQTGSLLGTPAYMSPEQAKGDVIDARTDVYAVGVLLYEMLTGGLPFTGENYNILLLSVMTQEPRRPSEVNPGFPAEAEPLVLKLLAKEPDDRPQTALEVLASLKDLAGFETRNQRLTQIGAGMSKTTIAGGDLGGTLDETADVAVASDMLSDMQRRGTPGAWAGTAVARPKRRGLLFGSIGAVAVAVVAVVIAVWAISNGEETSPKKPAAPELSPAAAVAVEALAPGDDGVLIEVKGAPEGAQIFYKDSLVPMNPFRAPTGKMIAPLRVEAEGHQPFKVSIVPDEDQVVEVSLRQLDEAEQTPEQTADREPGDGDRKAKGGGAKKGKKGSKKGASKEPVVAEKPTAVQPPVKTEAKTEKKSDKKKLSKGGRGTEIAEEFE
jgi:serine/threonine-protein kinase